MRAGGLAFAPLLVPAALATPVLGNEVELADLAGNSGVATFYHQGGVAGSCGAVHSDDDIIVALSESWNVASYCGHKVRIKNTGGGDDNNGVGKVIEAVVQDTCPGCDKNHLDLSLGSFKTLTGGNLDPPGRFNIEWDFV